jgi:hypothetical protein
LVINHIAAGIPRVLLFPGLEGKGGVDEIEVDEVEPEFLETGLESRFDALGTMMGIPELRNDKNVLSLDFAPLEHLLHPFADLFFGFVTFRRVEQAKSGFQRRLGRAAGCDRVGA